MWFVRSLTSLMPTTAIRCWCSNVHAATCIFYNFRTAVAVVTSSPASFAFHVHGVKSRDYDDYKWVRNVIICWRVSR